MANATARVAKQIFDYVTGSFFKRSTETLAAETTFYTGAFLGTDDTGYLCKGDDTQAWLFAGVVRGEQGDPILPAGTAGDATLRLNGEKPPFMVVAISGVAVTDIGKTVYALYDNEGTLNFAATTYANVVGTVEDLVYDNRGAAISGLAVVRLAYDGIAAHARLGAAKRLAATGTETLSKFDVGKTIFCANTAAKTVNLPPIADVPAGRGLKIIKDHTSDTNPITLDGNSAETIEGSATVNSQDAPYDAVEIVSNGTLWVYRNRDVA